jgi:hypothetical protein
MLSMSFFVDGVVGEAPEEAPDEPIGAAMEEVLMPMESE